MDDDAIAALLARVPGWDGRARVIGELGGFTNRNLLVEVDGERFVLRLSGERAALLEIRRSHERDAAERAAALGFAPAVVAFLVPEGFLVYRYVDADPVTAEELAQPELLAQVATILRRFHALAPMNGDFDAFRVPFLHREAAIALGVAVPAEFDRAAAASARIEAAFDATPEGRVPCHNDLLTPNFLRDASGKLWLVDWEHAGNNDRYFDLGNLSVNNHFDEGDEERLVRAYFGAVSARRLARLRLMRILSDFQEAMWGVVQQGISAQEPPMSNVDYGVHIDEHFERVLASSSGRAFDDLLAAAARLDPPA